MCVCLPLQLTSLGGRSLRDKFPENPYFRHHHVPIYPCDVHPDSGMQLFLDGSLQLRRDTFVKTEFRYHVNWRLLTPYDDTGRQFKLHPVAFRELLDFLHTPYVKPDDELFAEAGMSNEDVDVDEYASIVNNHSDLDKVNLLQAQSFREYTMQGLTNTTTGSCCRYQCWSVGMGWVDHTYCPNKVSLCHFYPIQVVLGFNLDIHVLSPIKGHQEIHASLPLRWLYDNARTSSYISSAKFHFMIDGFPYIKI